MSISNTPQSGRPLHEYILGGLGSRQALPPTTTLQLVTNAQYADEDTCDDKFRNVVGKKDPFSKCPVSYSGRLPVLSLQHTSNL